MTVIREAVTIQAPIDEVWSVVADPRNLPRWNRYVRAVRGVPRHLTKGSTYHSEMGGFGVRFKVDAEVLEVDPPRFSRIRLSGPLDAEVRTWLRADGTSSTHLEHEVDYHVRAGALGAVIERVLRLFGAGAMLRRGVRAQKNQIEGGGPPV